MARFGRPLNVGPFGNGHASDLFGGHRFAVEVDAELRFRDIDLRGQSLPPL